MIAVALIVPIVPNSTDTTGVRSTRSARCSRSVDCSPDLRDSSKGRSGGPTRCRRRLRARRDTARSVRRVGAAGAFPDARSALVPHPAIRGRDGDDHQPVLRDVRDVLLDTQYFQFAKNYTPLAAGVAILPFPTTMMSSPRGPALAAHHRPAHDRARSTPSLAGAAGLFFIRPGTPYVFSAVALVLMACGAGLAMPSATTVDHDVVADEQGGRRLGGQRHDPRGRRRHRHRGHRLDRWPRSTATRSAPPSMSCPPTRGLPATTSGPRFESSRRRRRRTNSSRCSTASAARSPKV